MWVVKLGGSLLGTPELGAWLDVLASQGDGRIVIVPGGGVFADAVRAAQSAGGYDDAAAHRMALLAMEQSALAMRSLQPTLVTAESELELAERSWQHRAILWLPSRMALADETMPHSWDVTSDSLAAWLAAKIAAGRLILVKSAPASGGVADWVATGAVDAAFAGYAMKLACPIEILHKRQHDEFAARLSGTERPTRAR